MPFTEDKYLQHELYLGRLATGSINSELLPSLKLTELEIIKILREYDVIATPQELNEITKLVRDQINSEKGWASVTKDMSAMAVYEANWQSSYTATALSVALSVPKDSKIIRYVTQSIMSLESGSSVSAGTWAQFVRQNKDSQIKAVNSIIRNGYAKQQTSGQISRRIKQAFGGTIRNNAEILTRTGFVHYASQANEAMVQDNTDVLKEYVYIVTFDNRTSDICIGISKFNQPSNRYKVGDPKAPNTPLHFACRTRRQAVTKGWMPTGTKASVGGRRGENAEENFDKRKDRRDGNLVKYRGRKDKAFIAREIEADLTLDSWLKTLPRWFVEDTLGKKRAQLYLDNKVSLDRFSDATGRPLTLAEIESREG